MLYGARSLPSRPSPMASCARRTTCKAPLHVVRRAQLAIGDGRDGKLRAPYNMQWSFALEHQIGSAMNLRAQYVGTRAVNQPYQTQVNGYQTVCDGCFG